jgi:hypothetical protein
MAHPCITLDPPQSELTALNLGFQIPKLLPRTAVQMPTKPLGSHQSCKIHLAKVKPPKSLRNKLFHSNIMGFHDGIRPDLMAMVLTLRLLVIAGV